MRISPKLAPRGAFFVLSSLVVLVGLPPPVSHGGQKLVASDGSSFAGRPAVSGDRIASAGAAIKIFRRIGATFVEEQILPPEPTFATALDGAVVVGADHLNDDMALDAGAVTVYRQDGSTWAFEQKLYASDPTVLSYFGRTLLLSGDELLVGSPLSGRPGAVYAFRFNGTSWVEEQRISASDAVPTEGDFFGNAMARSGDWLAVSGENGTYVFRWNGSSWVEEQILPTGGLALAMMDDVIFVGTGFNPPEIVVYRWSGVAWVEEDRLDPPNDRALAVRDLATFGDVLLAGFRASFPSEVGAPGAVPGEEGGFAGLYGWDGASWTGGTLVPPVDLVFNGLFGQALALTDEFLVIQAANPNFPSQGSNPSYYVFPFAYSCGAECFFDFPIEASKFKMVRKPSGKQVVNLVSKDRYMAFPSQDAPPSAEGAVFDVFSAAEGSASHVLPAGPEWELKSSKSADLHFYKNKDAPAGPSTVKKVKFRAGRTKNIKLVGASVGLPMAAPQGDVAVRWTTGSLRMCALFDATTVKKDIPGIFVSKGSVPWGLPDCSDASMP